MERANFAGVCERFCEDHYASIGACIITKWSEQVSLGLANVSAETALKPALRRRDVSS